MKYKLLLLLLAGSIAANAQNMGINATGSKPDTSAILDLNTGNSGHTGFLPEQVALTSVTDNTTIILPAPGLFVYNNGSGGLTPAGYYYNSGTPSLVNWVPLLIGGSPGTGWSTLGNNGSSSSVNFIGTTDPQSLAFRVNDTLSGWIDNSNTYDNTFMGYKSGYNIFPNNGSQNTGFGFMALAQNANNNNTAMGYQALSQSTSTNCTAVGSNALAASVGGYNNTAVGSSALQSNVSGPSNTAVGTQTLMNNTDGGGNTAVGFGALQNNDGSQNIAIGQQALANNLTGNTNCALGFTALEGLTTASSNTAVGFNSGYANNGSQNVFIGDSAGVYNTIGTNNTFVGCEAGASNAYTSTTNSSFLGFQSGVAAATSNSNSIYLGNSSIVSIFSSALTLSTYSDKRIKDSVKENIPGLAFITKLRPVTYHLNIDKENAILGIKDNKNVAGKYDVEKITQSGFIAQEVEAAAKSCGYDFCGVTKPGSDHALYSLGYTYFVMPLVKAVQEQQVMIDSLKLVNEKLQKANTAMLKEQKDMKTTTASIQNAELKNEQEIAELKKLVYTLTEKADATTKQDDKK